MTAVKAAVDGKTYLNPRVGAMIAAEPVGTETDGELRPREQEILRLLALGHTNRWRSPGGCLPVAAHEIETHRASIQRKLDLSTRAELTRYALEHRLLEG